jgi:N-acetylmuramoyl-L-alanine amidase
VGPLVLTVWLAGGGSANAAFAATTTVRPGDTLSAIATRYHTTVTALAAANGITNPNLVFAGAKLTLPGPALPPGWGPGGPLPAALLAHPDRLALRPDFLSAANASAVPPSLLEALCWWESGWQSTVSSSTGAIGLCQLEQSTVTYAQTTLLHNPALNPLQASDNIAMAAAYIHDLAVRDGGNVREAVAAYYQGLSSVQQKGLLPSTQNYVTGIFNYSALFAAAG